MILQTLINHLETVVPLSYQESYDNSGLIIGEKTQEISSALITIDITEEVIEEAIQNNCDLIISHHPLIFKGIKKITGSNYVERCILKAIRNNIAIYSIHTNLDSIEGGVNSKIGEKLGLSNCKILSPAKNLLVKLATYVPEAYLSVVRDAIFSAGAGVIGNYDECSFSVLGEGTYRGNEDSQPFSGKPGLSHKETEFKVETILPKHLTGKVLNALLSAHPYEEVAYDIIPLENEFPSVGIGLVGDLNPSQDEIEFLTFIKSTFGCNSIKHTQLLNKKIQRVAVCGGSGSFLLSKAISSGADLFVSADFKYHDYFDTEKKIVIADIGHYESEQFTKQVISDILLKKFPTFALRLSDVKTNPVSIL